MTGKLKLLFDKISKEITNGIKFEEVIAKYTYLTEAEKKILKETLGG